MGIAKAIRSDFSAKISLKLAGAVLVLTVAAAAVITPHQTRQLEELTLDKATTAAKLGARYYGEALDHAIDAGLITVADAFDRNYLPIKGFDFGQRPRFHTRFDSVTDGAVLVFQDQFLLDPDFTFAIGTDDHGYIPTHDTVFSQALIGNAEKDNLNNNKTRGEYAEAVRAAESLSAVLVQDYLRRRTGERMWDVSSPNLREGKALGCLPGGRLQGPGEGARAGSALAPRRHLRGLLRGDHREHLPRGEERHEAGGGAHLGRRAGEPGRGAGEPNPAHHHRRGRSALEGHRPLARQHEGGHEPPGPLGKEGGPKPMIRALRLLAPLFALLAALTPPLARAAGPLSSPAPNPDTLTAQEREVLLLASELAKRCGEAIERWLGSNEVSEDRLFDYLYYPIAHTDPPKFNTDWDGLADRDVRPLEEATLAKSNALVYAVLVDKNGYVASHNQRYSQPLTHDRSVDFVNNQTKRFFNNHVEILAARNTEAFLFQRYEGDSGETLVDLAVPVKVRGRHFGAVRISPFVPSQGRAPSAFFKGRWSAPEGRRAPGASLGPAPFSLQSVEAWSRYLLDGTFPSTPFT